MSLSRQNQNSLMIPEQTDKSIKSRNSVLQQRKSLNTVRVQGAASEMLKSVDTKSSKTVSRPQTPGNKPGVSKAVQKI